MTRPAPGALVAALAGGAALRGTFAVARVVGATRVDLASRIAPGRPVAGQALALALATATHVPLACRRPRATMGAAYGLLTGATSLALLGGRRAGGATTATTLVAHLAGGLVTARVAGLVADDGAGRLSGPSAPSPSRSAAPAPGP